MRAVVTCGPAIAPIDEVRRITNISTGGLGMTLANALGAAGHEVACYKSETATTSLSAAAGVEVRPFSTNDDLLSRLRGVGAADAVFHAAALCDYEVGRILDQAGSELSAAKIPSRSGALSLVLRPAVKVLPVLRDLFPDALIVGWKYELNGARADALEAAARQLHEARTDFCVVNGAGYGTGFGLVAPDGTLAGFPDGASLCHALLGKLA